MQRESVLSGWMEERVVGAGQVVELGEEELPGEMGRRRMQGSKLVAQPCSPHNDYCGYGDDGAARKLTRAFTGGC